MDYCFAGKEGLARGEDCGVWKARGEHGSNPRSTGGLGGLWGGENWSARGKTEATRGGRGGGSWDGERVRGLLCGVYARFGVKNPPPEALA